MTTLQSINSSLNRDFPRYRLRESLRNKNHILIEYKMGSGYWNAEPSRDPDQDIQMKEGFIGWGTITKGDRIPCHSCNKTIKIPIREFKSFSCPHCGSDQPAIAYFDLNGDILDYFHKLSKLNVTAGSIKSESQEIYNRNHQRNLSDAESHARENAWKIYGNPRNISRIDWHSLDVNNNPVK